MKKTIIFVTRLNLFVFSYLLYLFNLLLIFLNFKNISKFIFTYAAYYCSISLVVSYKLNKEIKSKLLEKGIHIANHDNPLDIFIVQYIFRMPTITTVDQHLNTILPFFKLSLNNFGHFKFNHLNLNERKSAYLFLKNICIKKKRIFIYPSGSIYTSIEKRFSKSISRLSFSNNLKVIAWKIYYSNPQEKELVYDKDLFKFIIKRFLSKKIEFNVKEVKVFSPNNFSSDQKYHEELKNFYIN